MRRLLLFTIIFTIAPALLPAGEFEWMTREFARQSGTPQLRIPFFGLARFAVAIIHPAGASDVRLAIFEHPGVSNDQFCQIAESTVGRQWKRVVQVREESEAATNIYVQQQGKQWQVLVASFEKQEVVFVQVQIRPEEVMKFVEKTGAFDPLAAPHHRVFLRPDSYSGQPRA